MIGPRLLALKHGRGDFRRVREMADARLDDLDARSREAILNLCAQVPFSWRRADSRGAGRAPDGAYVFSKQLQHLAFVWIDDEQPEQQEDAHNDADNGESHEERLVGLLDLPRADDDLPDEERGAGEQDHECSPPRHRPMFALSNH
jgi:hypothetical protein